MGRGHSSPPTLQGGSMRSSSFQVHLRAVLVIFAACFAFTLARGQNPTHVITGTVEKVDAGAKTVAVKTVDGTVETVEWLGDKTVHTTEGTVEDVGKGTKTVAVKTADGTKEAFEVSGHATVDTGKTVGRYSALGAKKGEHVTVYYTEEAGKKIAHVFKHL